MQRVAIVYNEPYHSRYDAVGEGKAALGVLEAVDAVHRALLELGCEVIQTTLTPPLEEARRRLASLKVDLVFNLFEGFCGCPETEALVPEVSAEMSQPFTGCPSSVLRLALDKAKAKVILNPGTLHMFQLSYPCIVKPRCEDASHGLSPDSMVSNFAALEKQVRFVANFYDSGALVEEYIDGREFNAAVIGNSEYEVLPISEIIYSLPPGMPKILTFSAKGEPDSPYFQGTKVACPAEIGADEQEQITRAALTAYRLLGCEGYARVDMRMDRMGQLHVIEVNPNPDISPGSGTVRQAEADGMTYTQFIERIVQLALEGKPQWASISVL